MGNDQDADLVRSLREAKALRDSTERLLAQAETDVHSAVADHQQARHDYEKAMENLKAAL